MAKRIGIFRGSFNPIHDGHVSFALAAIKEAKLDKVYLIPENNPFHKSIDISLDKRVEQIHSVVKQHKKLGVVKLEELSGYLKDVMPIIKTRFKGDKLVFLMGSDIALSLSQWPDYQMLADGNEVIIAMRSGDDKNKLIKIFKNLKPHPDKILIIDAPHPDLRSSAIVKKIL